MPPQQAISPVDVFLTKGHPSCSAVFDEEMLRRMQQPALIAAFVKISPFLDLNPPVICSKTYVIDICIFRQLNCIQQAIDELRITKRYSVLSNQYLVCLSAPLREVFTIILSIDCDESTMPTVSFAVLACQGVFSRG